MGDIIRFTHKKCGFRFDFYEGIGFGLFRAEREAGEIIRSGEWGEHWKLLLEQYPDGTVTLRKTLCYCPKCNMYYAEPRIVFYVPEEGFHYQNNRSQGDLVPQHIITEHYRVVEKEILHCPKCQTELTVMENVKKIPCLKCGELRCGRIVGNWD